MTRRRLAGFLLGLLISGAAAAWLALTVDLTQVGNALGRANPAWLLPAFAVLATQAWVRAMRWSGLVEAATGRAVPASRTVDPMLSGYLANAVLPGRVGEVVRTVFLARRESIPVGPVAASVVIERAADILALALVAGLAMAGTGAAFTLTIAAVGVGVLGLLLVARYARVASGRLPAWVPRAVAQPAASFLESLSSVPAVAVGRGVGFSAVAWLGDASLVLLVGRALGLDVSIAAAILIGLGGSLATALPAAPGYIATYELGAVTFGAVAGIPTDVAVSIAIVVHLLGVGTLALAGAVSLGRMGSGIRRLPLGGAAQSPT